MQEIRRSFLWLALAWGAAVALLIADAVVARAQEAREPARTSSVEEIVVTAQKREETLQEAPVSVSALSGFRKIHHRGTEDTEISVPGSHTTQLLA